MPLCIVTTLALVLICYGEMGHPSNKANDMYGTHSLSYHTQDGQQNNDCHQRAKVEGNYGVAYAASRDHIDSQSKRSLILSLTPIMR